jgi:multimeric flavodoxin WrbA
MKVLGDVKYEYLFLKDVNLGLCKGCYMCMLRGEDQCPLKDDRATIEKNVRN